MPKEEAEILETEQARFRVTADGTVKARVKDGLRPRDPKGRFAPKDINLDPDTLDFCSKISKAIRKSRKEKGENSE